LDRDWTGLEHDGSRVGAVAGQLDREPVLQTQRRHLGSTWLDRDWTGLEHDGCRVGAGAGQLDREPDPQTQRRRHLGSTWLDRDWIERGADSR
jgi:hypothetical protein